MDFIYLYEIEQRTSCNCFTWSGEKVEGRDGGGDVTNVQYKLFGIVTMDPPYTRSIS
jgi:hypothetical protein